MNMPNAEHPENAPPPGTTESSDLGKGHKYMLVKTVLGFEPDQWIAERRTQRPGSKRPGMSYAQIAEEMNALLAAANVPVRLTHESMRRWDPAGEFLRNFDREEPEPPERSGQPEAGGEVPPAIFRTPGEAA
jgi:hypothetical protein